ncbi:DUF5719 family protein [Leucobacter sp. NPDC058333]|uniref:DUF5719 family protein n=1 Tax=Leucobacter sp. NPDC058333 TaxID=3346450 RepID=UPI00364D26F4
MSDHSRLLRGGARAVTGLLVVAAAGAAVLFAGTVTLPAVDRKPLAMTVDTTQDTTRTLVCAGSFSELGADPTRPGVAIPVGDATTAISGKPAGTATLTRSEGGGLPSVVFAPMAKPLAAAQFQALATESARGAAASSCAEPLNEQWLLGGASSLGFSTTLSLGNPGTVPATVAITVYDENGEVDAVQTAGVLVAPGTVQTVSLNGYAPDRDRLAVRVESTGAPIAAHLGVSQSSGIDPFGLSGVTPQTEPSESLVIPGIENADGADRGPNDSGEGDAFPVVVRALAPGDTAGTATVTAIDKNGKSTEVGSIKLAPNAIGELNVATLPAGANALVLNADVPIIGGAVGSADNTKEHDFEWFEPAPVIAADAKAAAPVVSGGRLVIANTGDADAKVTIESASGKGKTQTSKVGAGAAVVVSAPADALLTSSEPIHAGVRFVSPTAIAGYPVLAPDPRDGTLTVYPR